MGILTDAQQAQAPTAAPMQTAPTQAQQAQQPQHVRIAQDAGKIIFNPQMQEAVAQKLMADGKLDEDEGGELVVNLVMGALDQIQKTGEASDPKSISLALPMVSQLVAEFCVKIEALPQEQLAAYAKAVLPCAVALFKTRVIDKQSAPETQEEVM
ncbi:hypothetical protein [Janthinobacterium sp. B9-8]|uniref:hypothetical protein n=1 Tax=Janthinobacterium sp. B9-8 TaxID=1236179 RepID=UPI00061D06B6|nr:hypothetical protein [Janthinobacterium sp. B9-8]AMC34725.1 hypothetical protein VN23_08945 [Janthinobacterium sp. B9-8]